MFAARKLPENHSIEWDFFVFCSEYFTCTTLQQSICIYSQFHTTDDNFELSLRFSRYSILCHFIHEWFWLCHNHPFELYAEHSLHSHVSFLCQFIQSPLWFARSLRTQIPILGRKYAEKNKANEKNDGNEEIHCSCRQLNCHWHTLIACDSFVCNVYDFLNIRMKHAIEFTRGRKLEQRTKQVERNEFTENENLIQVNIWIYWMIYIRIYCVEIITRAYSNASLNIMSYNRINNEINKAISFHMYRKCWTLIMSHWRHIEGISNDDFSFSLVKTCHRWHLFSRQIMPGNEMLMKRCAALFFLLSLKFTFNKVRLTTQTDTLLLRN